MLMNVRMVNSVFEDNGKPSFDPLANTEEFVGSEQSSNRPTAAAFVGQRAPRTIPSPLESPHQ
jgi:hypothetical protein